MAFRIVSLEVSKNGKWIARKGIPADTRAEYKRLYGVRQVILRVPAGTSKPQAKAQLGQWLAEVETRIERIRAAAKGIGQPLTQRNALALSGRWYEWFLARHHDEPGSPEHWGDRKEHLVERVWYPHAPVEHLENSDADPSWPWTRWPEVREVVHRGIDANDRAPRGRELSVREGLTRIIVDWSGSWQAARPGNWLDRSPATKAALGC